MAPHPSTLAWKIPWTEEPGRLQSMGSLRGTTERLQFYFSLSCIGEGNGNPLQYSCLENPRDRGAQWAAIYGGHTESDTTEVTQQQQQQLCVVTPWTAAYQAPPSMGPSRQEYWSGVPLPSPTHSQPLSYWISQCWKIQEKDITVGRLCWIMVTCLLTLG